jgi:hypothetical protein
MAAFQIANADNAYVEVKNPDVILHVVTPLPLRQENTGYCPNAKQALMRDVEAKVKAQGLAGYEIHWADGAPSLQAQ